MSDQNIATNNIKGGSGKNRVVKGSLLIDLGKESNKEFQEDISISADYELYKGMDSSLSTQLSKNFKNISFKFNKNETLIKIYVIITDSNEVYHRGFYKNKNSTDMEVINHDDYIVKTEDYRNDDNDLLKTLGSELNRLNKNSTDMEVINHDDYIVKTEDYRNDDNDLLKTLGSELNRLNKDSYYITYTINNYKNYFFYIKHGEENASAIKDLLDSNFSTEGLDKTLRETMSKINKNIIKVSES